MYRDEKVAILMIGISLPVLLLWLASYIGSDESTVSVTLFMAGFIAIGFDLVWILKRVLDSFDSASDAGKGIENAGVFFGMAGRRMALRYQDDDGHILVVGGAGSGKSSAIAIPTLSKTWASNFLAIDIKGELAKESGRQARIFNPCSLMAYGYDPFYFVDKQDNQSAALQEIALTLLPEPPGVKEPFWIQSAQSILTGHLIFAYSEGVTFYESLKLIQTIETKKLLSVDSEHEEANIYLNKFLYTPPETLGSIMAHVSNAVIPLIGDPDIRQALSKNKDEVIVPGMLDQGESIFLQIPMGKIDLWKNFITLIVQQFLGHFQRREERANQPVLFLLDEFARFGRMDGIMNGLATLRSKKVSICIIIQSLAQLDAIYGEANRKVISDNCVYKAILGASDADTQSYFSRMAGTHKTEQITRTKSKGRGPSLFDLATDIILSDTENPAPRRSYEKGQSSQSITMVDEPIIRPEEFGRMGNRLLLLAPDRGPAFVTQRRYYQW